MNSISKVLKVNYVSERCKLVVIMPMFDFTASTDILTFAILDYIF